MADTSIYRNMLGPVKSVADYDNAFALQKQNQIGLQEKINALATHERDLADERANRAAFSTSGGDAAAYRQNLIKTGNAKAVQAFDESQQKLLKTASDIGHVDSQTLQQKALAGKTSTENMGLKASQHADRLSTVADPSGAVQWLLDGKANGAMNEQQFQMGLQNVMKASQDPAMFNQWKTEAQLGARKFAEMNKPTIHTQNLGGASQVSSIPGMGGAPTVLSNTPITQSADNAATQATSRANNAASVGAQYANANATRAVAASNVTAAGLRRDQDTEMKLADDYRKQSKDFGDATSAYKQISSTLDSANKSPAATLAAATKFMKILDPGSVVRESELAMALAATGVFDRVGNYMNTLQNGKTLTTSQVKDFKKISADLYEAAKQVQRGIDKDYKGKAETYKLRPEMVVQDLGQNAKSVNFGDLK